MGVSLQPVNPLVLECRAIVNEYYHSFACQKSNIIYKPLSRGAYIVSYHIATWRAVGQLGHAMKRYWPLKGKGVRSAFLRISADDSSKLHTIVGSYVYLIFGA